MDGRTNILICGVGGQGILLASDVLVDLAVASGFDAKKSEVHGMSQRGGSVVSHVRFGGEVRSPIIPKGTADVIFSFERMETLRYIDMLKHGGTVIINDFRIYPAYSSLKDAYYPPHVESYFDSIAGRTILVPATALAQRCGTARATNVVMLGMLSRVLPFEEALWKQVIENHVPEKYAELNLKAFDEGRNFQASLEFTGRQKTTEPESAASFASNHGAVGNRTPHVHPIRLRTFADILEAAKSLPKKTVVVAGAENPASLGAALEAKRFSIADVVLVGNQDRIRAELQRLNYPAEGMEIIDARTDAATARKSVDLIRDGRGAILLKGKVDTATLLKAVLDPENGLRTGRLLSDAFLFEYPDEQGTRLVMITDGGINLAPDIYQKLEILLNGVEVAHAIGIANPKVAVLSASESIQPNLPSSVDAAILTSMNRHGEITGCEVEGPLALDLSISRAAVKSKGLDSHVAGEADILLMPSIEAGNALAKGTTYFSNYPLGHVVVGAVVPILIPSRSDGLEAKLHSIALGVVMSARAN